MEEWLGPGWEQGWISKLERFSREGGKKVRSQHCGEGKAGLRRGMAHPRALWEGKLGV